MDITKKSFANWLNTFIDATVPGYYMVCGTLASICLLILRTYGIVDVSDFCIWMPMCIPFAVGIFNLIKMLITWVNGKLLKRFFPDSKSMSMRETIASADIFAALVIVALNCFNVKGVKLAYAYILIVHPISMVITTLIFLWVDMACDKKQSLRA